MSEDDKPEYYKPFSSPASRMILAFGIFLLIMTMVMDRLITMTEDKRFKGRYDGIEMGMTESMVVSMLGAPDEHSAEFTLGDREDEGGEEGEEGFEAAYKRAAESGAEEYLIWHVGFDAIYVVGFNKEEEVIVLETGGT